jgi:hypothetical protein
VPVLFVRGDRATLGSSCQTLTGCRRAGTVLWTRKPLIDLNALAPGQGRERAGDERSAETGDPRPIPSARSCHGRRMRRGDLARGFERAGALRVRIPGRGAVRHRDRQHVGVVGGRVVLRPPYALTRGRRPPHRVLVRDHRDSRDGPPDDFRRRPRRAFTCVLEPPDRARRRRRRTGCRRARHHPVQGETLGRHPDRGYGRRRGPRRGLDARPDLDAPRRRRSPTPSPTRPARPTPSPARRRG